MAEVVGHSHHVDGKLHEAAQVAFHHIAGPRSPDGSQAGPMGHPIEGTQFVFQLVGGKVLLRATLRQVIMR